MMDGQPLTFGELLRSLRLGRAMSLKQVATDMRACLGEQDAPARDTLERYERRAAPPRSRVMARLARYYGVPVDYFTRERSPEEIEAIRRLNAKSLYEVRKGW